MIQYAEDNQVFGKDYSTTPMTLADTYSFLDLEITEDSIKWASLWPKSFISIPR